MTPAIVYSRHYDIGFFGIERLHPFDSRKYGRAFRQLRRTIGAGLDRHLVPVDRAATDDELRLAHSPEYLESLRDPRVVAAALELPVLGRLLGWLLRRSVLDPMRWAVQGTTLAAKAALERGVAVNLSGGYHHAKPDRGEGFCLFADVAIAVRQLRRDGSMPGAARIVHVDLDAHQGNGVCHQFRDDPQAFLFDMYNAAIYPWRDAEARRRIDCDVPLRPGCPGDEYLRLLREKLPRFLDSVTRSEPVSLTFINAGTDVYEGDPLGRLALSADDVLNRDAFAVEELRSRGIPVVVLPSGGYTRESYRLIASSVERLLRSEKP